MRSTSFALYWTQIIGEHSDMTDLSNRAKLSLKRFLVRGRVLRLARTLSPTRIAILKYHSIKQDPASFDQTIGHAIIHSAPCFARQMELVSREYHPVSLDDILAFLQGRTSLPRRPVAVTFDDGFLDNMEIAAPILNRYGLSATFFVTVGFIGSPHAPWYCRLRNAFKTTRRIEFRHPNGRGCFQLRVPCEARAGFLAASEFFARHTGDQQEQFVRQIEESLEVSPVSGEGLMMQWDHVRALRAAGHSIGSHTVSHPNLAQIAGDQANYELYESRSRLAAELGEPVLHFSYPNPIIQPHWTPATSELVAKTGYQTAVVSDSGPVQMRSDPLSLSRVPVPNSVDGLAWNLECTFWGARTEEQP